MFEAYNKSVPLVYSRDSAHVRELKVILMLVLGQHECVRGEILY